MEIQILLPLIFAILSPFFWGLMNVLDKFVIMHKVKNPISFAFIAGMVHLAIGILLALFLGWHGFTIRELWPAALAGILLGSQFYFYYLMLAKEDVSNIIGFVYFYPIIISILSFLFLHEVLSVYSYIGMALIIAGVISLSIRTKKIKLKLGIWMIVSLIFVVALYEFFIKVSTINLPELNGIAVNSIFIGLALLPVLLHKKTRGCLAFELKNIKWAALNESFTFLGIATTYFAMKGLPATVVSSLAATQPLIVLFIEKAFHKAGLHICSDQKLAPKLISISLIVAGILLLYLPELIFRLINT